MKLNLIIFLFLITFNTIGQNFVFDTVHSSSYLDKNDYYYSKTDFLIIDTLKLWNYKLDTNITTKKEDSIKTIGQLHFWRTIPIDDSLSKIVYNRLWTPHITFDIYSIKDTVYCYQISLKTRILSSCVPPDVGGDIIITDNYVLVSRGVCLSCTRYDTKIDYCRPVINYLFTRLDKTKITTIQSLVSQFTIEEGKLK